MSGPSTDRLHLEAPIIEATNLLVAVYRMHEVNGGDAPTYLLVTRALEALFEMRKVLGLTRGEECPLNCTNWHHEATDPNAGF
jgi:hypothetical protein